MTEHLEILRGPLIPMDSRHATPMPPSGSAVLIVRWRRDSGAVGHRFYLRRHAAQVFVDALRRDGRTADLYVSRVRWHAAP